jgi:hypothetical protein
MIKMVRIGMALTTWTSYFMFLTNHLCVVFFFGYSLSVAYCISRRRGTRCVAALGGGIRTSGSLKYLGRTRVRRWRRGRTMWRLWRLGEKVGQAASTFHPFCLTRGAADNFILLLVKQNGTVSVCLAVIHWRASKDSRFGHWKKLRLGSKLGLHRLYFSIKIEQTEMEYMSLEIPHFHLKSIFT